MFIIGLYIADFIAVILFGMAALVSVEVYAVRALIFWLLLLHCCCCYY